MLVAAIILKSVSQLTRNMDRGNISTEVVWQTVKASDDKTDNLW